MISELFTGIGDGATGFVGVLKNILEAVIGMFGSESQGTFTFNAFGYLVLAVTGVGLSYFGIRWITRLIKLRG